MFHFYQFYFRSVQVFIWIIWLSDWTNSVTLEGIKDKIGRNEVFVQFYQTYLKEKMLSRYAYTHTHTHTYIYIYIYVCVCVCVSVCACVCARPFA